MSDPFDPFERAARQIEKERLLLERDLSSPAAALEQPLPEPIPVRQEDLDQANWHCDPTALPADARGLPAKRFLLRILNLYTAGQVLYNNAVARILNSLAAAAREMARRDVALAERLARAEERATRRLAGVEERREAWETRIVGDLRSVEERVSELESGGAEAQDERLALRDRVERLEKSLRVLEAETETLRRGGGAQPGERAGERVALLGEIAASLERGRVLRLEDDPFGTLLRQPDGSLGGLVLPRSVEALPKDEMGRLLALARTKLRPGAVIVVGAHA